MSKRFQQRKQKSATGTFQTVAEPLLQRLYCARGVQTDQELAYQLNHLLLPDSFKGMPQAVALLVEAITQQKRILIIGDFDADGATSSAVAVLALRAMGAGFVDFLVPNRFEYGYGLTPEIVAVAKQQKPDLIVTVDNGISSIAGVNAANELGMRVLITDHHLPGESLPAAAAIVNPNQPGCEFVSKNLAGVGVIFYVMSALRRALDEREWFASRNIPLPNLAGLLDLVALGTVADVVPLDYNNRILVDQGLKRIRAGQCRPGIRALLEISKRNPQRLVASDLGFALGPRLNAAGRLDDMSLGIQCLLTDDEYLAREIAQQLDELNQDRKQIETGMQVEAKAIVEKMLSENSKALPNGICLYDASWHQGVIGIVASRIKDHYHRPVIAFADSDDGEIKGSARSISGVHIRDVLDAVAAKYPQLLSKFGGHAMAAGMSLSRDKFTAFQQAFNEVLHDHVDEEILTASVITDGELLNDELTMTSAQLIRDGGPWGQHFPEPLFEGVFSLVQQRIVGGNHLKLVLAKENNPDQLLDAIAFNIDTAVWPNESCQAVKLAYKLDVNEFRGQQSLQLMVDYIEAI